MLKVGVYIEARTRLRRVITMSMNLGVIHGCKMFDCRFQRYSLRLCSCVCGLAFVVEPSDIDDSDTILIVTVTVGSDLLNWSTQFQSSVNVNNIMVTDVAPTFLNVPFANIAGCVIHACSCRCAVDNNVINLSHCALNCQLKTCLRRKCLLHTTNTEHRRSIQDFLLYGQ